MTVGSDYPDTTQARRAPYEGLRVLDLTGGIAGALAGMLLTDSGAEVIRVESRRGQTEPSSGYRVWHRGKRRALLDPSEPDAAGRLEAALSRADVLLEDVSSAETEQWGISPASIAANHPHLVHCTISAYGDLPAHQGRPAIDALVAARTGLQWEMRGVSGTSIRSLSDQPDPLEGAEVDPSFHVGPDRPGPMYGAVPWASNGAAYLASIAIGAALLVRERTGRGQHVSTSLAQGALVASAIPWQRVENVEAEHYLGWTTDPRAPKGFFRTSDDAWIQQWVPAPNFMLTVSDGERLVPPAWGQGVRESELRIETDYLEMVLLHHYYPQMVEVAGRHTLAEWLELASQVNVPFGEVRPPEAALRDELLLADGCVTTVPDPDHGSINAVGRTLRFSQMAQSITAGVEPEPQDASALDSFIAQHEPTPAPTREPVAVEAPLAGVRVLDLGLAVAGPYGGQLLAQLGADVIKINSPGDDFWMKTQYAHCTNRDKRSLSLNLKSSEGKRIFTELVRQADVVHHNMRWPAVAKLGITYEDLRAINPRLVYCHTRGFEHGPRNSRPANDQTGGALTGTEWMDGGADSGGEPIWPSVSLGDVGNGLLSVVGVLQALRDREISGSGQFVDTSIAYVHLLNASTSWVGADGTIGDRPVLDRECWGVDALRRIYPTADGWLCLAVVDDDAWTALTVAVPSLADDDRFLTAQGRRRHDVELATVLTETLAGSSAEHWWRLLDEAGVPSEVCASEPARVLFDDPDLKRRGWISQYEHPILGAMEMGGRLMDFDATPTGVPGRAPLLGEHNRDILTELGYSAEVIEQWLEAGVC